jgi:protease YdgD
MQRYPDQCTIRHAEKRLPASTCLTALALAIVLAGCAAKQEVPAPAPVAAPWKAAIGKLLVEGFRPCTAVLVAPELILTAAHCLNQSEVPSAAGDLRFLPNFGAEPEMPAADGWAIRAAGGAIREGRLNSPEQVRADWSLVEIDPAVTSVAPLPLLRLSATEMAARIAAGDRLFTAGYGYGAMKALGEHLRCALIPPDAQAEPIYHDGILVTTCIIRIGDSGGPVVLLDGAGKPWLAGIFAGFGLGKDTGRSYAVNAGNIVPYLGAVPISGLPEDAVLVAYFTPGPESTRFEPFAERRK